MDIEGSDGGRRGDDQVSLSLATVGFFLTVIPQEFERKSALFALASSSIVIINMWENQVGLYNAANMGLLKIVFEEHLSLYGNLDEQYVGFV